MDTRAAQALIRFGLGRLGNEAVPDDPAAWLGRQLDGADPGLAIAGSSAADGLVAFREDRKEREERKLEGAPPAGLPADAQPHRVRDLVRADGKALADYVLTTNTPFRERLVWFWANHFTVSTKRGEITCVVMPFVREAIRPHVTGRFVDMLFAVMRHPAMLMYLDNAASVGPDSPVGVKSHRGLNENLARESLELHTVTPASGYTQQDVTSYAKLLTGWSFELNYNPPQFLFRVNTHEPGPKTLMGQTFPSGAEGGIDALTWLGDHPWTFRNIATKLVRHFVADDPPPAAVSRIETVLRETRGDLRAASLELIRLPEAWQPLTKLRSPRDYVISVSRALNLPPEKRTDAPGVLAKLGEPTFGAPLPNGWPDTAADWSSSEALLRRVDWVYGIAGNAGSADPEQLAQDSLGPFVRKETLDAMAHAGSRRDAITLLLTSPEFMRR
jgi:uncharacterized protein (DUF1800 family)